VAFVNFVRGDEAVRSHRGAAAPRISADEPLEMKFSRAGSSFDSAQDDPSNVEGSQFADCALKVLIAAISFPVIRAA
jgi:hypothetical protein